MDASTREPTTVERSNRSPADRAIVAFSAMAAAASGVLVYNVLPMYLGSVQDAHRLSSTETGLLGTGFFFGFNLAGLSALVWIRKISWRLTALCCVPIIISALLVSVSLDVIWLLILAALVCGLASGAIYTIGTVIIGDTSRPQRWFGVKVAFESIIGTMLLFALPTTFFTRFGPAGTSWGIAGTILILAPLLLFLPAPWQKTDIIAPTSSEANDGSGMTKRLPVFAGVLALLTLFAGVSAIWAFAERMGKLSGFSSGAVASLLGLTLLCGVAGSLFVAAFGGRLRPLRSYLIAISLILVSLACIGVSGSFALFAIGNCLYMIGWSAATPLACAEIAALDRNGKMAPLIVPAIGIGSMIGPGVAGWLLDIGSPTLLLVYVAGAVALSGFLMFLASYTQLTPKRPAGISASPSH